MLQAKFKPHIVFPGTSPETKYLCKACNREMREIAFRRMVWVEQSNDILRMRHATALHPVCNTCQEQMRGRHVAHPLYTKYADRFFARLLNSVKGGARSRGIAVFIEKDDILGLYLEQGGRCAMSGVKMLLEEGTSAAKNRLRPSVDRVDSAGNYTTDNIQLICSQINIMKNGMSQVDFLRWCERIVNFRGSQEDDLLKQVNDL